MESTLKLSNYSLNYSTLIARGELDVYRFLGLCRGLGLEGASLHLQDLPDTRIETLARVRRAYLDHGLSVAMVTVSTEFGQPPDGLGAELDRRLRRSRPRRSWGPHCSGSSLALLPEADRPAAWESSVKCVRQVCQEAARVGLPIGLQNHNHGGLCGTGADLLRFVEEVQHPNLTVVLDCGQYVGSPGASGLPARGSA